MDSIEFATMLPGAVLFSDSNRNPTWRAHIRVGDETKAAFVKLIEPRAIFVECACAILGRLLGLPIPKPSIVLINSNSLDCFKEDQYVLAYGSEDVKHPSFLRLFSDEYDKAFDILSKHPKLLDISVFDEWIANSDRHDANILYGGNDQIYFIDHELAIPEELKCNQSTDDNQLLRTYYSEKDELEKYRVRKELSDVILPSYINLPLDSISDKSCAFQFLDKDDVLNVIEFLNNRLEYLKELFDERIKLTQREIVTL
ncbi:HipA family kinase [Photobacterium damselae]|uniref:HipA family kinase n=1 Tax=Photobacterium damselae TaxID=38293 RepID=UPI00370A3A9A